MSNEADTCRQFVIPKLTSAGWFREPHSVAEQQCFTDGRIVVAGDKTRRLPQKRVDYLLRYTRDLSIAVVEAKRESRLPSDGLQQAKDYAELLGLKFAYATNGHSIVEFDYLTGLEREIDEFPSPNELWLRLRSGRQIDDTKAKGLLTPSYHLSGKSPRYYQEIAINRALESILDDKKRSLLTLATGTGKTVIAFQICWKLWNARWNKTSEYRRPKMLYLTDRNILVDDPKDKIFAPFGEARWKIQGEANKSREMYFAIYQAIAKDERRPGLYRDYPPDFFDLIIVDECHRGSASDESNWREILEYFEPSYQLGMTATPKRQDNVDTYAYFGEPIYTYSLKQGIEDGFLAPYQVRRIVTSYDDLGWRPGEGTVDRYGQSIPDLLYQTKDFERKVALRKRTEAIAVHITKYLKETDRFGKTIVFCVDQEHADEMRRAIANLNSDLVRQYPDYVCRVTADEGDIGRGHLSRFQDLETATPVILTTSQLLTTGVDAPTCKNIVLVRSIESMTDFKQIIGRGTRVCEDYGKLFFTILDYTGSATRLFADPAFDGEPIFEREEKLDNNEQQDNGEIDYTQNPTEQRISEGSQRRKYYFDDGQVEIVAEMVYQLDSSGNQLRVVQYTEYAREQVRTLYTDPNELRLQWLNPELRKTITTKLAERGISVDGLFAALRRPDADPLDLLCHIAFSAPLRSRRDRAESARRNGRAFFEQYGSDARAILEELLDKYAEFGDEQFNIPDILKVSPFTRYGNVIEIANRFGGPQQLREAVRALQSLLYAA